MAGKPGKTETISSISDVLGFILEQSEVEPEKRRPVRPPETAPIQASDEYIQTITDALAMPGTFLGDQYLGTLQSLVDPEVKFTTQERMGSVKIKSSDLKDFVDNPDEFVDKLFEKNKNIRKMERVRWAGEQLRMLSGSAYAKKFGLFEEYGDLKPIMERAVGQAAMDSREAKSHRWMTEAAINIRKKGYISRDLEELQMRINTETDPDRKIQLQKEFKELYSSTESMNPENFRKLLNKEFESKERGILRGRSENQLTESERDEIFKTKTAKNVVNLSTAYENLDRDLYGDVKKKISEQKVELRKRRSQLQKRIDDIDASNWSDSVKKAEKKQVQLQMKTLGSVEKSMYRMRLMGSIGKLEGAYYGLQQTLGPGSIEAFLNGDFFNYKKGYFGCPSDEGKVSVVIGKDKEDKPKFGEVTFVRSKTVERKKMLGEDYKFSLIDNYNDAMVQLYYLNPTTWVKTLYTGEGFAWISDNLKRRFEKLKKLNTNPKLLENLEKRSKMFGKWAHTFNTPTRTIGKVSGFFQGKLTKMRGSTAEMLKQLKFFKRSDAAMELLGSWAKIGGSSLSGAVSQAIIAALGITSSAIAGPLGLAITAIVSSVLDKITKVSIKFIIYAVFGLLGVALLAGMSITHKIQAQTDSYSREIPTTIYYNEGFEDYGGVYGSEIDPNYDPGEIPPLSDQECVLSNPSAPCTQGFIGIPEGYTHHTLGIYKPVDLSFIGNIYAPQFCDKSKGNCIVTRAWEQYTEEYRIKWCGGTSANPGGELYLQGTFIDDAGGSHEFSLEFYHVVIFTGHVEDASSGIAVGAGEPIARIGTAADGLNDNKCWHGAHLHYSTKIDGAYVDPLQLLNSWGCSLPREDQCLI